MRRKHYNNVWGIARLLNVSNPSKTQKGNQKNNNHVSRKSEVLQQFYHKANGETNYHLMLPHKFFRIALLQETKDIINAEWFTNNNEKIKNAWKALDNQTNYVEYFDDFQATNDLRKKSGKEKKDEFKNKIKKITTLYQRLY